MDYPPQKKKTHPSTHQEKFHNILQLHPDHLYVFTDVSNDKDKTVCTAVLNKIIIKKALSIFTTEARAIDLALNIIPKSKLRNLSYSQTCSRSNNH